MSWLFGSTRRGTSPESDLREARDLQIRNLRDRVPNLEVKANDHSLYHVHIQAPPDGRNVTLRIFLPTKFPAERPGE